MSNQNEWAERLATLEKRSYETYKARLEACKRLEMRARALNGLVVALSLSRTLSPQLACCEIATYMAPMVMCSGFSLRC